MKLTQNFALQAIETKYLSPTERRGSRVKASCYGGSLIVSWQAELDSFQNHARAARMLCEKLQWTNELMPGQLKNQNYVFTLKERTK